MSGKMDPKTRPNVPQQDEDGELEAETTGHLHAAKAELVEAKEFEAEASNNPRGHRKTTDHETGSRRSSRGSVGSDELPLRAAAESGGAARVTTWKGRKTPPTCRLRGLLRAAGSMEEKRRILFG